MTIYLLQALEIRRQALQKTIVKNRNRLNELESEKQSLEQVFERTSNLYGQTIRERHQMTKTWSTAVQTLNARHYTIHETMQVRKSYSVYVIKSKLIFISRFVVTGNRAN